MKLKYLFPSLIAAITMLVSCSDDNDPTYLDEIKVSQSYVAIPAGGGSISVEVKTVADWTITDVPEWLALSANAGGAGETTVTFSADAATDSREATVKINCAGQTQLINIIQMTEKAEVPLSTCAEVLDIEAPVGKTYRVKGVCTKISNTQYGNWYLNDGTGEVLIYGTLDAKGNTQNFLSWGLEVGDEITVEGPKKIYGSDIELVDVTVISIEKSLIKVDSVSLENATLPHEGGEFSVALTCKGNGVSVVVPEDAKSWLSVTSINTAGTTATVTFNAAANDDDKRETTLVFTTTDGKKTYSSEITIAQNGVMAVPPSGDGTEADPYNVTAALSAATTTAVNVYVKGIVCEAPTEVNEKYGSCTYYISADGTERNRLQIYSGLFLKGEKFTSADQVKVGDEVIVVGDLKLYNGAAELDKNNWIYSLNGDTEAE